MNEHYDIDMMRKALAELRQTPPRRNSKYAAIIQLKSEIRQLLDDGYDLRSIADKLNAAVHIDVTPQTISTVPATSSTLNSSQKVPMLPFAVK